MDFLGLRNLTLLRNALDLIRENQGIEIDFSTMDYNDAATYEMMQKAIRRGFSSWRAAA